MMTIKQRAAEVRLRFSRRSVTVNSTICYLAIAVIISTGVAVANAAEVVDPGEFDQQQLFEQGMDAREQGDYISAIEAFQTILSNRPKLQRARLELALTYFHTFDLEKARREAKAVLDDPATPPKVKLTILAFLAKMKAAKAAPGKLGLRHTWVLTLTLGLMHDDNANIGPGDYRTTIPLNIPPRKDNAKVVDGGVSHSYRMQRTLNTGGQPAFLYWQSRANIYSRSYSDESPYNYDVLSLGTGPSVVAKGWRTNLNAQMDLARYGSEKLFIFVSINPSVTWQFPQTELTLDGQWADRNYKQSGYEGYDSKYRALGLSLGRMFFDKIVSVQGGVEIFDENAEDSQFSNDGGELFIGANWSAWSSGTIYVRASREERDYDQGRDDHEREAEIGFNHTFTGKLMKDWILSGNYIRTRNNSDENFYQYDRDRVHVSIGRRF